MVVHPLEGLKGHTVFITPNVSSLNPSSLNTEEGQWYNNIVKVQISLQNGPAVNN